MEANIKLFELLRYPLGGVLRGKELPCMLYAKQASSMNAGELTTKNRKEQLHVICTWECKLEIDLDTIEQVYGGES